MFYCSILLDTFFRLFCENRLFYVAFLFFLCSIQAYLYLFYLKLIKYVPMPGLNAILYI